MDYTSLPQFYQGQEWRKFRKVVIADRTNAKDGFLYDEYSGKPILRDCDIILHHKIELTLQNVNDRNISLNPENIMVVTPQSHNEIHNRFGGRLRPYQRKVYYVWGPPLSGKSTYVREAMQPGDLVLDIDRLWEALSGEPEYSKPRSLKAAVFAARDAVFDSIRTRAGSWQSAWVVEGGALLGDRKRRLEALGAEPIRIEATMEECLARLEKDEGRRPFSAEWKDYVEKWFRDCQPDPPVDG